MSTLIKNTLKDKSFIQNETFIIQTQKPMIFKGHQLLRLYNSVTSKAV